MSHYPHSRFIRLVRTINAHQRKIRLNVLCLIVGASVLMACGGNNETTSASAFSNSDGAVVQKFGNSTKRNASPQSDTNTQTRVIESFNDLSLQLLRQQGDAEPGVNTISSGFSLAIAMSMLQRATAAGDFDLIQQLLGVSDITEDAFYNAVNAIDLDLQSRNNDGLELRSANQLFVKPGFELDTGFMDVLTEQFNAPIAEAQFAAQPEAVRLTVNEWAAENTNNLIPELLSQPLDVDTVVALLNATLLDAKWRQEFTDVDNLEFTTNDGRVQSVAGFYGVNGYEYLDTDDALSVSIQYEGSKVSLMIIVPEDIETYTANLTASGVSLRHNNAMSRTLALTIPNWKTKSSIDFTTLPMTSNLAGRAMNMTRMTSNPDCCVIADFKQEAIIEVDKDGTRAAAVTVIGAVATSVPPTVNIDQPFIFMIRDEPTGLILFSGRVLSL